MGVRRAHFAPALAAGFDAIECDFWHARGRLALRHERKLPGLPLIFDTWYFRFAWGELSLRHRWCLKTHDLPIVHGCVMAWHSTGRKRSEGEG